MSKIFLVSCARGKLTEPAAAGDLYTSAWFQKAKNYARANSDRWYILSALHGVVRPTERIAPYEKTLNLMTIGDRRLWGTQVFSALRSLLEPGDEITILAGDKYREFLVPALEESGFKVHVPLLGKSIGKQLSWLKAEQPKNEVVWERDLNRFYRLLNRLALGLGGTKQLGACTGHQQWPIRGVYFFFESGEMRRDNSAAPRVVRVGTHAVSAGSKSNLWTRLRTHRGHDDSTGNHRGSIFRLHVGKALMAGAHNSESIASWGTGQSASKEIRDGEVNLEKTVSKHIRAMSILWLEVGDDSSSSSDRAYIERHSIGLLSRFPVPLDPPSSGWLGRFSPNEVIRNSGLWNLNYVGGGYDPAFLDVLADYVEITLGKLTPPKASIAPTDWHTISNYGRAAQSQMQLFKGSNECQT